MRTNLVLRISFLAFLFLLPFLFIVTIQAQPATYEIKEINNISYYSNGSLDSDLTQLNILIPEGVQNPPVLMWIGGGAWAYVDRHKEMKLC